MQVGACPEGFLVRGKQHGRRPTAGTVYDHARRHIDRVLHIGAVPRDTSPPGFLYVEEGRGNISTDKYLRIRNGTAIEMEYLPNHVLDLGSKKGLGAFLKHSQFFFADIRILGFFIKKHRSYGLSNWYGKELINSPTNMMIKL